jgi:hypothetical protein
MAKFELKPQFAKGKLVVDGIELNAEFFAGNVEAIASAFPQIKAFIQEVKTPVKDK